MKKLVVLILLLSALLMGCTAQKGTDVSSPNNTVPTQSGAEDKTVCADDSDCICGGIDTKTSTCYLGNREYYDKYVDTSKDCPDFCTGIAGNLAAKCIDSKCMQVYECLTGADCSSGKKCQGNRCVGSGTDSAAAECSSDSGCVTGGCSGQLCAPKSKDSAYTTCEYREEYGCLKHTSCGCVSGKCAWKGSAEYSDCLAKLKSQ